jgi:hypothetical protein
MEDRRGLPGAVITSIGLVLFFLGVFGSDLPWAPDNLFLPIVLIFLGRAISRRQKEAQRRDGVAPKPGRPAQSEPVVVTSSPPPPEPVVEPPPRRQAPRVKEEPRRERVIEPVVDEPPPVVVPPIVVPERRSSAEQIAYPASSKRDGGAVYPETGGRSAQSMARPAPSAPSHRIKTSDELLAEAKERLKKKPR